jgi:hypothetical protein
VQAQPSSTVPLQSLSTPSHTSRAGRVSPVHTDHTEP